MKIRHSCNLTELHSGRKKAARFTNVKFARHIFFARILASSEKPHPAKSRSAFCKVKFVSMELAAIQIPAMQGNPCVQKLTAFSAISHSRAILKLRDEPRGNVSVTSKN